ncbi:protein-disulfide reductase DsbD [Ectothiorhodospira mobilis]|uniref:protein-disulfide reductase DsbD n=1 Tax=Ectothiorhodospira mobilis TaxID=195064 RepID=UPI003F6D09C9
MPPRMILTALLYLLVLALPAVAAAEDLLPPEKAFALQVQPGGDDTVMVHWDIADGYYLYGHGFEFTSQTSGIQLGEPRRPEGKIKEDEFFGQVETYRGELDIVLPLSRAAGAPDTLELTLRAQGCADAGVCYPPQVHTVSVDLDTPPTQAGGATRGDPATPEDGARPAPATEQDRIAAQLAQDNLGLVLLAFFGFGLLLTFTPCVFPMIPILSNIILGQKTLTPRKAFTISLAFVLAMAVTYTVAGVFAGLAGANLQAALQNPWVIGGFVIIFIALALSMFGFYDLQMPAALQTRLSALSNRQQGGTLVGAAVMGFLSALIVGPCVTAPLVGALLYISQTGDAVLGGLALFSLSLGMGLPLLILGTSAGSLLPRAGAWMDTVKAVFGVLLLAMAIWLLERVAPATLTLFLWAALLMVSGVYMGAASPLPEGNRGWRALWKGLGLVILVYGILLLVGAASGARDPFHPLEGLTAADQGDRQGAELRFQAVNDPEELEQALETARAAGQPVLLDFYADWCVECTHMARTTLQDPEVVRALSGVRLLKADVTAQSRAHRELMRSFDLFGPPAMIFFNARGEERRHHRLVGYKDAEAFLQHLHAALGPTRDPG